MKKGVKAIKGKREVKVGVWENYNVSDWYPDTPLKDRNEDHVKWEAYNITTGKAEKILEKEIGHFRFQQKAVGQKYLLVAYMFEPELSTGIEITVVANEKPEILRIDLSDINDKPITKTMAYGQHVNVHVHTVGMVGHHLNISLWEDDAEGAGHNPEKNKHNLVSDLPARVGYNGIAHVQFLMTGDFAKRAKANSSIEGVIHEYYVTVYALGELKASKNINLIYPEQRKKETRDHLEGKEKPKENIPPVKKKVPLQQPKGESDKKHEQTGKKGITNVYFVDSNNHPITGTFKQTQLKAIIISSGLIGKDIKLKVFEEDDISDDKLFEKTLTITGDKMFVYVDLCEIPKSWGDDSTEVFGKLVYEDNIQELFIDIEVLETHTHLKSKTINVDAKAFKIDKPTNTSKLVIDKPEVKKEEKKSDCPNCDKDITIANLKQIFTSADDATIKIVVDTYNKRMKALKMNTCWNKAHFFAQAIVESGKSFALKQGEGMNYLADDLYLGRWNEKKKKYVTIFSYFKSHKEEAYKYGRIEEIKNHKKIVTQKANEEAIANRVYANRIGNKDIDSGDGWNFRGCK
jgi:predicted chitinase